MAQIVDDFSPIYVGDTGAPFNPVFQHVGDGTPVNLTGATITMKMQNENRPDIVNTCTGTWTINDAANGKASYAYTANDVSTAGTWVLFIVITINGKPVHADTKILEILYAP